MQEDLSVSEPHHENMLIERTLNIVHSKIQENLGSLSRVSIALYDPATDMLKTFASSDQENSPLITYEYPLKKMKSLCNAVEQGAPRVIEDLIGAHTPSNHTVKLIEAGYRSSLSIPIKTGETLLGVLFFDACKPQYFDTKINIELSHYAELIASLVKGRLLPMQLLKGVFQTLKDYKKFRDGETVLHLERMSRYSRLIAQKIKDKYNFSDEYIEYLFQFAGIHDIGKIGVPEQILFKSGQLNEQETKTIQEHVQIGYDIVKKIKKNLEYAGHDCEIIMENVIMYHHERLDGSGYPLGKTGAHIPIEGKIVAVADVFDALTNDRPYKKAWSIEKAKEHLIAGRGTLFDPDCVDALFSCSKEIEKIREQF